MPIPVPTPMPARIARIARIARLAHLGHALPSPVPPGIEPAAELPLDACVGTHFPRESAR